MSHNLTRHNERLAFANLPLPLLWEQGNYPHFKKAPPEEFHFTSERAFPVTSATY